MSVTPIDQYQLLKRKHTISPKQLAANRHNARLSTGPSTARGRAISSQNSRKYTPLPLENSALPAMITAKYYRYFIPSNKTERALVDTLVLADRLRRHYLALEYRAIEQEMRDIDISSLPETLARTSRRFSTVPYRLGVAESNARNAFKELESLRAQAA